MGLHADMEAQQVCEQLYQLIIVLVSVRDHTGPMRGHTSRAWPRGVRARTLGAHANANTHSRPGSGRRRGVRTSSHCSCISPCVRARACVRACVLGVHAPDCGKHAGCGFCGGLRPREFSRNGIRGLWRGHRCLRHLRPRLGHFQK